MTVCARCRLAVGANPDGCYWCCADLCSDCWERYGRCDHPEAAEWERHAEAARRAGTLVPIIPNDPLGQSN